MLNILGQINLRYNTRYGLRSNLGQVRLGQAKFLNRLRRLGQVRLGFSTGLNWLVKYGQQYKAKNRFAERDSFKRRISEKMKFISHVLSFQLNICQIMKCSSFISMNGAGQWIDRNVGHRPTTLKLKFRNQLVFKYYWSTPSFN